MSDSVTDRVFARILKDCKLEAEKDVKDEIKELRAENKRLIKERDTALATAHKAVANELKELHLELVEAQREARIAEKDGTYFEELVEYWFDDEVKNVLEHLKYVSTDTLKKLPEVRKKAKERAERMDARYKKLAEKAKNR